jgi:broad specificity phosphatase PhoE
LAVVAFCGLISDTTSWASEEPATTTIYVVRHAEKSGVDEHEKDPPLTERGMARAADLRALLVGKPIAAVFATPYRRTGMTAGPTAGSRGLETIRYRPGAPAADGGLPNRAQLLKRYAGRAVLVVGHSNTVARIVAALGGQQPGKIARDDFSNLFVVTLHGDRTRVRHHRYGPLTASRALTVSGNVLGKGDDGRDNVSGIAVLDGGLLVCADEGTHVQEWSRSDDGFVAQPGLRLPIEPTLVKELDLEGVATGPGFVYAIGSHAAVRKSARARTDGGKKEDYADNRERLGKVVRGGKDQRDRLFRLPVVDGRPQLEGARALDLRSLFENDPFIGRSTGVPSKENGLDVEALARDGAWLVIGLRGPVLRGNFAPIVRVEPNETFTKVKRYDIRFVNLDGHGVRGMTRCATGYLLISGPPGEGRDAQRLYHWDGEDMLLGKRTSSDESERRGRVTLLGTIPCPPGARAEGLALRAESTTKFSILIVYDGAPGGALTAFEVRKVSGL